MSVPLPVSGGAYLAAHWWVPLVRGIFFIVFAVVLVSYPISAVFTLVIFFGAFALVDGVFAIVTSLRFSHPDRPRWWWMLIQGLCGILIGAITFVYPGITASVLALLVAIWAVITGGLEIGAGIRLRGDVPGEIFLILAGVLSIGLGALLFLFPLAALLTVVWLIAAYTAMAGIALLVVALRLRRLAHPAANPR